MISGFYARFLAPVKFANDFDTKFNCGKSDVRPVGLHIGKRFNENVSLCRLIVKIFSELKYLGVHVCAG